MIETEFEYRLEALYAMRGRAGNGESIDESVVDVLSVTGVAPRVPRHVVGLTDFLSHRAIVRAHPGSCVARHAGEMSDRTHGSTRHRKRARIIRMHHHVQKRAELERRGIEPSLLASLPRIVYRPQQPVGIGADCKGHRVSQRGADLDYSRSGGGYVDRHLRQIAAGDPLVAALVAVVERDLVSAQESLHLRNVSSEVLARRRARANLGDRRIATPDAEDRAPARLRLNGSDRRRRHGRMPRYRVGNSGPQF